MGAKNIDTEKVFILEDKGFELPKNIQKRMLEFFMRTSIPRKKAKNKNYLSENEEDR